MALRYLARREHSCLELTRKLEQQGVSGQIAGEVVETLAESNLVSDERFAEAVARHRVSSHYGPLRIRAELRQKGVNDQSIASALAPFNDGWHERAYEWVCRRQRGELDRKSEARLYRGGVQRGFSHDQVMRAIERLRARE